MFTDAEAMAIMTADRAHRRTVAQGQAIVDRKNSEITLLTGALQQARADLKAEQLARIAVEEELATLRRLVLEAL